MDAVLRDEDVAGTNRGILLDCLSVALVKHLTAAASSTKKSRKRRGKPRAGVANCTVTHQDEDAVYPNSGAEALSEFTEYVTSEIFHALPIDVQNLSFAAVCRNEELGTRYSEPLTVDIVDHLISCLSETTLDTLSLYTAQEPRTVLRPAFNGYVTAATVRPPEHQTSQKPAECELCSRDWVPLTYHHLIPRQAAAKAVKRGWCEEWETSRVAWLCRACHSFVHGIATNDELAREWATLDALASREYTKRWVQWVGRVRWKSR